MKGILTENKNSKKDLPILILQKGFLCLKGLFFNQKLLIPSYQMKGISTQNKNSQKNVLYFAFDPPKSTFSA